MIDRIRRMPRGLLIRIAVTAAFAAGAAWLLDLGAIAGSVAAADPRWLVPGLLVFTLAKYVDSWRWRYLMRDVVHPPQRVVFATFLLGNMLNNLLPLRAGDIAKTQLVAQRYGGSRAGIAASVFVAEATLDGAILTLLLLGSLLLLEPTAIPGLTAGGILAVAIVAGGAFALAVGASRATDILRRAARKLPRVGERVATVVRDAREGLAALRGWRRMLGALAASLPVWLLEAVTFALIGRALALDVPPSSYVLAMVAANLATAVPVTLGNFGPYEVLVGGALALGGAGESEALSFALTAHVAISAWIQVTGLLAIWSLGLRPRDLFSLSSPPADPRGGEGGEPAPTEERP